MKQYDPIPSEVEELATRVVEAAYRVHKALGPGLLESVYEVCLCHELSKAGIAFQVQVSLPVEYEGTRLDAGLRLDILVDEKVIVELKAVEKMIPLYKTEHIIIVNKKVIFN